jgi:hypothetical protein
VTITAGDLYVLQAGPWDGPDTRCEEVLDRGRLTAVNAGADPQHHDLDVSLALMDLVRDDMLLQVRPHSMPQPVRRLRERRRRTCLLCHHQTENDVPASIRAATSGCR